MARVLALDVGKKRIGVAVSDEMRTLARPLTTIVRSSWENDLQTLSGLLAEYKVDTLIVGYPRSLSGDAGPQALSVQRYAERLAAALAIQVVLWDERYSTVEAMERFKAAGRARRPRSERKDKGRLDAAAAAVILQSYLDANAT